MPREKRLGIQFLPTCTSIRRKILMVNLHLYCPRNHLKAEKVFVTLDQIYTVFTVFHQIFDILFFFYRFEIESGILDEDGEADLENFLDDKDIKQLGKHLQFSLLMLVTTMLCRFGLVLQESASKKRIRIAEGKVIFKN